jgi:VCBS repeat-containing protein
MTLGVKASKTARVALLAAGLAFAAGATATPASVAAGHNASKPQSCAPGTIYTHIRMNPQPFATFGSLQAGQSVSFFVQPLNVTACVAGAVVYVSMTQSVAGDSVGVQIPSECGGATSVTSAPIACTTDSTGKLNFTYKAPATIPDHGSAEVTAANHATGGGFSTHDFYEYEMLYTFSASPIAKSGNLNAGQQVSETLAVTGADGTPQPGEKVFLSLTSTASHGGTATVGGTALTGTPKSFTADSSGNIVITYTAPTNLPSSGVDTITANGSASGTNTFNSTQYAFAASVPMVSVGDIAQVEGDGHGPTEKGTFAEFDVTLSAPQTSTVTVQYLTVCGIGDKGCKEDYLQTLEPTPRSVTFAPGQVTQLIKVVYYSYVATEAYPETMFIQLLNPTGAVLGRSFGNGTIIQDDETTTAEILYEGNAGVVRGDSGTQFAEFTVTLALPSSSVVTFHYATTDGTAVAGTDYTAESGTATIPVGITSAHIQVPILPDTSAGPTLTFTITISGSSGPVIEQATGTGTIFNWN